MQSEINVLVKYLIMDHDVLEKVYSDHGYPYKLVVNTSSRDYLFTDSYRLTVK